MAFVPFDSEGAGGNVAAASISDQFNNLASGLQSMIPGMGPAPSTEQSYDVADNKMVGQNLPAALIALENKLGHLNVNHPEVRALNAQLLVPRK